MRSAPLCSTPPRSIGSAQARSPKRWSASKPRRNGQSPAGGSSSPAAGPSSSFGKSADRPKRSCSRRRLLTRSTSSCSTARRCSRPQPTRRSTSPAMRTCRRAARSSVPTPGPRPAGTPPGGILGDNPTIRSLFDKLPLPTFDESVEGTRQFFRELNRLGITGVSDPGGFNLTAPSYQPLFKLWHDSALSVRVVYSLFAQRRGHELEDYQTVTQMLPMGFGDDWLRFNGVGENVAWGMYNNDNPTEAQKEQLYQIYRWAASRRMTMTQHWNNNRSVHHLLDVLERVNRETPIAPLRWSIAHLNDASPENLGRMKMLGIGWLMQNAMFFNGEAFLKARGSEAMRLTPPIMTALKLGIPIGGGTDAHRVMSYNPFVSLQWMVDGKTVGGTLTRDEEQLPSREEALRFYTLGSAWFTFDDEKRGSLKAGKLADLAVLTQEYLTVPTGEIGSTESLFTMVGGRIVYATGPYSQFEDKRLRTP